MLELIGTENVEDISMTVIPTFINLPSSIGFL